MSEKEIGIGATCAKTFVYLLLLAQATASTIAEPVAEAHRENTIQKIVSVSEIVDESISSDGKSLLFEVSRPDYRGNIYRNELWYRSRLNGKPRLLLTESDKSGRRSLFKAKWAIEGRSFFYVRERDAEISSSSVELRRYRVWDFRDELILRVDDKEVLGRGVRVLSYEISQAGTAVALVLSSAEIKTAPGNSFSGSVATTDWPATTDNEVNSLWVLDIPTGHMRRLSPPSLNVEEVSWSPVGDQLAVSGSLSTAPIRTKTDLFLLEVSSGKLSTLVTWPGWDFNPVWSPDGAWIAFATQRGDQDYKYFSWLGLVSPSTLERRILFSRLVETSGASVGGGTLAWTRDGKSLVFAMSSRGESHLYKGDIRTGEVKQITKSGHFYGRFGDGRFSYSARSDEVATVVQDPVTPPELYVLGLSRSNEVQISNANAGWPRLHPIVRTLHWRSGDDRFNLEGLLLLPPDYQSKRRYSAVVALVGGPAMVPMTFNVDGIYPYLALAFEGYAVFLPNSRGRGGYGRDLQAAMSEAADYLPGPYEDVMAGVDELIREGIASPDRLAIVGHSYGGTLACYAITHTGRFKAAGIFEGSPNSLSNRLDHIATPDRFEAIKDQRGFGSPWEKNAFDVLIRNSPIFEIDKVSTPTLLEYGSLSLASTAGTELFNALRFFSVPSQFIVYPRTGHQIIEPKLRADSYTRQLTWLDCWLRAEGKTGCEAAGAERRALSQGRNPQ